MCVCACWCVACVLICIIYATIDAKMNLLVKKNERCALHRLLLHISPFHCLMHFPLRRPTAVCCGHRLVYPRLSHSIIVCLSLHFRRLPSIPWPSMWHTNCTHFSFSRLLHVVHDCNAHAHTHTFTYTHTVSTFGIGLGLCLSFSSFLASFPCHPFPSSALCQCLAPFSLSLAVPLTLAVPCAGMRQTEMLLLCFKYGNFVVSSHTHTRTHTFAHWLNCSKAFEL